MSAGRCSPLVSPQCWLPQQCLCDRIDHGSIARLSRISSSWDSFSYEAKVVVECTVFGEKPCLGRDGEEEEVTEGGQGVTDVCVSLHVPVVVSKQCFLGLQW